MQSHVTNFAAILMVMLLVSSRALATTVVIVRTSDADPYLKTEATLRQSLGDCKFEIKGLLAREVSDKGIDASIGRPDVVVAVGTAAAKWLHKQLPGDVKLTYCMVSNPLDAALMEGHAASGVTTDVPLGDELKLVAETLPHARSVGLMYRSNTAEGRSTLADLQQAIPSGWHVEAVAINDFPTVASAIDALMQKPIDIAWTTADQKIYDTACVRSLLLSAVRSKVPVWGYSMAFVRAGALLGVGVEPAAQGRQAAALVIKILKDPSGFKAGIADPEKYQIGVNLIVADQIGVGIPNSILHRAAFIYQAEK